MPTNWEGEWRKIYVRLSSRMLALPVALRGLAWELVRIAERPSGRVSDSNDVEDIALRLNAHQSDRELIVEGLSRLSGTGFLVVRDDGVFIDNFGPAQEKDETRRKRKYRESKKTSVQDVRDSQGQSRTCTATASATASEERGSGGEDARIPCPKDLALTDEQLEQVRLACAPPPEMAEAWRRLVAAKTAQYVAGYLGKPDERRTLGAWRAGLVKAIPAAWRDTRQRKQLLGQLPDVPASVAELQIEYERDLEKAIKIRAKAGSQDLPRRFHEKWPRGAPADGGRPVRKRARDDIPPGEREHEAVKGSPVATRQRQTEPTRLAGGGT